MNKNSLINSVLLLPVIRAVSMTEAEKRSGLEAQLPSITSKILYSYDWDFAVDEETATSVIDQGSYTLKGKTNDARSIINIRYGSNLKLIDKMRQVDYDEWSTGRTISTVIKWVPDGIHQGFPRIRLYSAPTASGDAIKYRYRRKDITLSEFPDDFDYVFESGLAMRIIPSFDSLFRDDLGDLIKMYDFGGGEDNQVKQDPLITHHNNRRARLFGWT